MNDWLSVINKRKKIGTVTMSERAYDEISTTLSSPQVEEIFIKCPNCNSILQSEHLNENNLVCYKCSYHFRMNGESRVKNIFDKDSIELFDEDLTSCNPLNFPNYDKKLKILKEELDISEGVITGKGKINFHEVYFGIMDFRFIMGSMGSVVGEKLTRMIEGATLKGKPVVIFSASGGARMQEGMLSLYQMVKTVSALELHNEKGLLYISVLTDPTMGGVTASFASIGDVIIAEKDSNIGFAGKRVIEKTINKKLPKEFQKAEFIFNHGLVDMVCERKELKDTLAKVLQIYYSSKNFKANQDINCKSEITPIRKTNKSSWERVQLARNINRPNYKDYIGGVIETFVELHGDRNSGEDAAIVTGLGYLNKIPVAIIASAKGKSLDENLIRNFGMAKPSGYRKVLRVIALAEKLNMPVICLIDTPGAYCGDEAEIKAQGEAIAKCIQRFSRLKVPVISLITGEGGSGGALALGVADYIFMLENSIYSVISPEGCASILLRDVTRANKTSEYLKLTADELKKLNIIDEIIQEPLDGAHENVNEMVRVVKDKLYEKLLELKNCDIEDIIIKRYGKFRCHGIYKTSNNLLR